MSLSHILKISYYITLVIVHGFEVHGLNIQPSDASQSRWCGTYSGGPWEGCRCLPVDQARQPLSVNSQY